MKRISCLGCIHRRPLTPLAPYGSVCHYLLDTEEQRGCPPGRCTRWQEAAQSADRKSNRTWICRIITETKANAKKAKSSTPQA